MDGLQDLRPGCWFESPAWPLTFHCLFSHLMMLNTFFNRILVITGGHCIYPCFPRVLLTSTLYTIFFSSHLLFIHKIKKIDSCERGMNLVAVTIIKPSKEYRPSWGSNQGLLVLAKVISWQSVTLLVFSDSLFSNQRLLVCY